jgi:hypothetical protein
MTVHELKSWPEFFSAIETGEKTFELRRNDRNYQVGDVLVLREWKGSFRVTTVNGQITGHGLDIGVVDDPIKGRAEASSKTIRDKTWNWLVDDFFSRFADHAGLLMIMTRWHVDDPVGRWIERFPETKILRYQAVAEPDDWSVHAHKRKAGEALFKELKPIEFLQERRKLSTTASWESLYQQSPIIAGGGVFPIDRFRIIQSVDRSNRGGNA